MGRAIHEQGAQGSANEGDTSGVLTSVHQYDLYISAARLQRWLIPQCIVGKQNARAKCVGVVQLKRFRNLWWVQLLT